PLGHFVLVAQTQQAFEGRLDHVVRIGGPERLREDVLDPDGLEDRPDRAARDDAGSRRRRLEQDASGAVGADDGVGNGRPLEGDALHALLGHLDSLLDGHWNFLRFARAVADPSLPVTHDDESGEGEVLAALDDLRDAIDVNDAVDQLAPLRSALSLALPRRPRTPAAPHGFPLRPVPRTRDRRSGPRRRGP